MQKYHNDPAALKKIDTTIGALSELFPVFKRKPWELHQPLACGIDRQLVDTGALSADETGAVMHRYVRRRMYQVALAAGGARYNLDGTVAGTVTDDQARGALTMIAKIEKKRAAQFKKAQEDHRADRKAAGKPNGIPTFDGKARPGKIAVRPPQTTAAAIATSLAGLRDAWRQRQAQAPGAAR